MYGIYANIGGILMVNVAIYSSNMDPMGICLPAQVGVQRLTFGRKFLFLLMIRLRWSSARFRPGGAICFARPVLTRHQRAPGQ